MKFLLILINKQTYKINKSGEEQTLEPKIEGSSTSLSLDLNILCIQELQFSKELHGVTTMRNQWNKDYIESWFQSVISLQHHSILQQFLAPSFQGKLVSHILAFIKIHFSDLGTCIFESLFRKWLHWKYSYT
jgi:hypothetical protein